MPAKFRLGETVITANAQQTLHPADIPGALLRHSNGDWGELDPEDKQANDGAVDHGFRILSVYRDRNNIKFWIITESDRSVTTVLLPEDY